MTSISRSIRPLAWEARIRSFRQDFDTLFPVYQVNTTYSPFLGTRFPLLLVDLWPNASTGYGVPSWTGLLWEVGDSWLL